MFDRVWNSLLANQPNFRSKSFRNKKNRAFEKGGCMQIIS